MRAFIVILTLFLSGTAVFAENVRISRNNFVVKIKSRSRTKVSALLQRTKTLPVYGGSVVLLGGTTVTYRPKGRFSRYGNSLSSAFLARNTTLTIGRRRIAFKGGTKMEFATVRRGRRIVVISGVPASPVRLRIGRSSISLSGSRIWFGTGGQLVKGYLSRHQSIRVGRSSFLFAGKSQIRFMGKRAGREVFAGGKLAFPVTLRLSGNSITAGKVFFDRKARLRSFVLYRDFTLVMRGQRIPVARGGTIELDSRKRISKAIIARTTRLKVGRRKRTVRRGRRIFFDRRGKIKRVR